MSAEITPQWNQCLAIIRDNIDEQAYDKWFEPIKPLKYVDNTLPIEVPSPFFPELLEQNFAKLIRYTLNKVYGESTKLMYRCTVDQENKKGGYTDVSGTNRANDTKITANSFASNLNQRYSFSTFIEGDCNKLPRTAGINISSMANPAWVRHTLQMPLALKCLNYILRRECFSSHQVCSSSNTQRLHVQTR